MVWGWAWRLGCLLRRPRPFSEWPGNQAPSAAQRRAGGRGGPTCGGQDRKTAFTKAHPADGGKPATSPRKVQGDAPFLVRGRHLLATRETALYPRGAAAWSSAGGIAVWPLGPGSGRLEAGSCGLHAAEKPVVLLPEFAVLRVHTAPGLLSLVSRWVPWSSVPSGRPSLPPAGAEPGEATLHGLWGPVGSCWASRGLFLHQ